MESPHELEHYTHHAKGTSSQGAGLRPSDQDRNDLQVRGVDPAFNRNFRAPGSIAYTLNSIISPEYFLTSLAFLLYNGGRALLTFGLLAHLPGLACLYWSLGEMMSMAPTAGGQYRFVAENAPKSVAKQLSYVVGWLGVLGWQSFLTAVCFATATVIQGLIVLHNPNYAAPAWHGVLLTIMVVTISLGINVLLLRRLPYLEAAVLVLRFASIIFAFAALGSLPRASTHAVITELGTGGWSNPGMNILVGAPNCYLAISGLDCLWHLSEEVVDASEKLPLVLWRSVGISWIFALITTVLLAVYIPDISRILKSPTGYPFIEVFYEAFGYLYAPGARTLTTVLVALFLVTSVTATANQVTASSRQLFGFARDGGIPFASIVTAMVHFDETPVPIWSISAVCLIVSALACIYLASPTALNAFNSLAGVALAASYMTCIGVMLWSRITNYEMPHSKRTRWSLDRTTGVVVNVVALVYTSFNFVFML
ncbi:hypothetical protein LTR37_009169 [Vermiconidia calcicola]|uniref:Uncharacterized protein n=1 Tax=Vermiconidia calcicola TaxID=1690605 RepID=A0ACC3N8A0_9PEZI|nr:hypothetical protein LTR37_009169 [Vermiconidia calcicola]